MLSLYCLSYLPCHNIVLLFPTVLTLLVIVVVLYVLATCCAARIGHETTLSIGSLLFPVIQLLPSRRVVSHCLITSSINYDVLPQLFPIAQPPVPQINQLLFDLQHLSSHLTPAEAKL